MDNVYSRFGIDFSSPLEQKKNHQDRAKVTDKDQATPAGGELPCWATFLTGCICLLLSSGGIWLGFMGIVGHYFGSYSNRQFYGLFEISGFIAIILGILFVIISVGLFILVFIILKEGLFARQVKHE